MAHNDVSYLESNKNKMINFSNKIVINVLCEDDDN